MRGFKGYAWVHGFVKASPRVRPRAGELWDASIGFYTVWVAHMGRRYGLLRALSRHENGATLAAISKELGLHPPAVRVWSEAAQSLGLIVRKGERYTLPARLRSLLVDEDASDFLGGQFSYLALRSLDFDALDGFFRSGRRPASASRHLMEATEEATRWDHTSFRTFLLNKVPELRSSLRRGARVLDVGCGTGGWVLRMAGVFPRSTFLGIDPNRTAIRAARATAKRVKAGTQVLFRVGTGETGGRGSFDLVHLGEVLYGVADKAELLNTCRGALRSGGCLVIAEGLRESGSRSRDPSDKLIAAMGIDFALQGSRFFTKRELEELLGDAGFRDHRFHHAGGGLWFIVAKAPPRKSSKT